MKPKPLGIHLLLDLYGCDPEKLNDEEFIEKVILLVPKQTKNTICGKLIRQYAPYGISAAAFLAESHLFIHTWPEYGYVAIDVFSCATKSEPLKARDFLVSLFQPTDFFSKVIERGESNMVGTIRDVPNKRHLDQFGILDMADLIVENKQLQKAIKDLKKKGGEKH